MAGQRRSNLNRHSGWSDFRLFCHFQGILDLDPQVSDGAFKLRMTKQELDSSPWAMSRTRSLVKSQARSLLSMAKLKRARSRVLSASWSLTRMAQISLTRSGAFCQTSFPLFQS